MFTKEKRCTNLVILIIISIMLFISGLALFMHNASTNVYAITITSNEAKDEWVGNLRYGYNVTAGKFIGENDALRKNAPILKPIDESGLYQYIDKTDDTQRQMSSENLIAYNAKELANQSASFLSGGINSNIAIVSMDIGSSFERATTMTSIYQERYEVYYQKIYRKSIIIQDDANLQDYLTASFKSDLSNIDSEDDALVMLNKYGTHLFTGFQYGGLMVITNYQVTNKDTINLSESLTLDTKIDASMGSFRAGTNFSFAEQFTNTETNENRKSFYKCTSYGGNS